MRPTWTTTTSRFGTSPTSKPTPSPSQQAYLTALAGATIDEAALEANYDIIVGDQWVNGTDYSRWVVAVPEPKNVLLLVYAAPILAARRRFRQRSHSNSSGGL